MQQQTNDSKQPFDYQDCIQSDHPYYHLLSSKLSQLPTIFQFHIQPESNVPETPYQLKIYTKKVSEKLNMFLYTYVFPCSYEEYEKMNDNLELQKSFDLNINIFECRKNLDKQTNILYLAYKKIFIIAPRDFLYIHYKFKKGKENWTIASSLEDEPIQGRIRGDIQITATRAIENQGKLQLSVYSIIDMKIGAQADSTKKKGLMEIRKYLDKCFEYIKGQKQ